MKDFTNKVAVITGAGNGIGKAMAKKCLALGMKVVIADINEDLLIKFKNELSTDAASEIIAVVTDVSNRESINHLASMAMQKFGKVNLLFNNAGIMGPIGPIWEVDPEAVNKVVNVNLMSTIHGLQAFMPIMMEQNEECHIVNTASAAGLGGIPNLSAYTSTKHAIVGLTETVYSDLKLHNINNINISVLCPGSVNTEFANQSQSSNPLANKIIAGFKASLKQAMSPEEVAERTFAAIKNDQFYILTHPELKVHLQNRFDHIFSETNPTVFTPTKPAASANSERSKMKLFDQPKENPIQINPPSTLSTPQFK